MEDVTSRFTGLTNFNDILCNANIREKKRAFNQHYSRLQDQRCVLTHNLFTLGRLLSLYHVHYLELT